MLDVLLICALKDEYDQVLAVTDGLLPQGWVERPGPRGWIIADACFSTPSGQPLRIRTTWATHMGREQAQAVASLLIVDEPIRCLAMTGICAGRRGKVALGDVIFADRLWSYDLGKITTDEGETRFQGDIVQFCPPSAWVQRMQQISVSPEKPWLRTRPRLPLEHQEDWILLQLAAGKDPRRDHEFHTLCPDWASAVSRLCDRKWLDRPLVLTELGRSRAVDLDLRFPRGLPEPPGFQVHVAPIATGATVTEDPGIFPRLATSMRKVLGVEMEASALGALGEIHGVPVVVAKAVSDFGDSLKDDRYRAFAARAAAECLIALLRSSADLLPDARRKIVAKDPPLEPNALIQPASATGTPDELIRALAEEYPDVRDARALWERAGGKVSEVENITRPRDLWQRLWARSTQGAAVRPVALLRAALADSPENPVILLHLKLQERDHG